MSCSLTRLCTKAFAVLKQVGTCQKKTTPPFVKLAIHSWDDQQGVLLAFSLQQTESGFEPMSRTHRLHKMQPNNLKMLLKRKIVSRLLWEGLLVVGILTVKSGFSLSLSAEFFVLCKKGWVANHGSLAWVYLCGRYAW